MYSPKPNTEYFLPEEDGHKVHFAEYGNAHGPAIISLHGGPGAKSRAKHAARFDLDRYRVVLFDQRGCGQSVCEDILHENTTAKIISDMERIREMLQIPDWIVSGSSWGSTLSLAYAEAHPDRTKALLISAIFLGDDETLEWFSGPAGVSSLFTDVWEHRNAQFQKNGVQPVTAQNIYDQLQKLEGDVLHQLVADIMNWEGNLMSANKDVSYMAREDVSESEITYAKVFMHYESNRFFMEDNQLIDNIHTIKHIPTAIVHGRHDVLCPFKKAWNLHKALNNAEILTLPQSNHAFSADGTLAKKYFFDAFLRKSNL